MMVGQVRMREIQGAIAVSAIFQMLLGYAGLIGFLLRSISIDNSKKVIMMSFSISTGRWITPLTITPAVAMIGVSLFDAASYNAQGNWAIAIL